MKLADTFIFESALGSANVDTIGDFNVVVDTIWLENAIFTKLVGTGQSTAGQFYKSAAGVAIDADDRIIYETDTGQAVLRQQRQGRRGCFPDRPAQQESRFDGCGFLRHLTMESRSASRSHAERPDVRQKKARWKSCGLFTWRSIRPAASCCLQQARQGRSS